MDTEARFGKKGKSLHYFGEVVWGVFFIGARLESRRRSLGR